MAGPGTMLAAQTPAGNPNAQPMQGYYDTGNNFSPSYTGYAIEDGSRFTVAKDASVQAVTTAINTQSGTDITGAVMPAGGAGQRGWLSSIYNALLGNLKVVLQAGSAVIGKVGIQVGGADVSASNPAPISRSPLTYTAVAGSPFTLTSAWQKVAATTSSTKGLRIAPLASTTTYDIEWVAVPANAGAPTDTYGEPVLGGEDFAAGLPIGDIYLKSATGQVAIVKTGA
jgi:hypothetical protein